MQQISTVGSGTKDDAYSYNVENCISVFSTTNTSHEEAQKEGVNEFCLFKGKPPSDIKYKDLGRVKYGKGSYGAAKDIVPEVVTQATSRGANAIVDFSGAQHFGFWPWRLVRPIVQGTAVKLQSNRDCREIGGTPLSAVLQSGLEPAK